MPVRPAMDLAPESGFHSESDSALALAPDLDSDLDSESAMEFDSASDSQSVPAPSLVQILPFRSLLACVEFVYPAQQIVR